MPHHVQSRHATPFLTKEFEAFKDSLEKWLGRKISDQAIDDAAEVYNRNRDLMWKVYELRKGDSPPLTGEEAMEMVVSSQMVDKQDHNAALETLLTRLSKREITRSCGTRLMVLGSENDDIEFIRMVESSDATFVVDDHCTGTRYFWNNVELDGDRLTSMADRYVKRVPCPSKDWPNRSRVDHVLKLAKDYDVQGAIVMQQKFCDPHEDGQVSVHLSDHTIPNAWTGREEGFAPRSRVPCPCAAAEDRRTDFRQIEGTYSLDEAMAEAKRCLQCDLRLLVAQPAFPPERWLEFNLSNVDQVPDVEGVFILAGADKTPTAIKGTANIQAALMEKLDSQGDARFFFWEENRMYSQRESELIQQHLKQYGQLPGGGDDELDDLF